jgi:excisionase family DNA binding protein
MEGYITTTQAADRLGVSAARVRQLVADGRLPVIKFGPVNMVKESDLDLVRHRRPAGRPPRFSPPEKRATGQKRAGNGPAVARKKGWKKSGKR